MGTRRKANNNQTTTKRPARRPRDWVAARRTVYLRLVAEERARAEVYSAIWAVEERLAALYALRGVDMPGRTTYPCPDENGVVCCEACKGCGGDHVSALVDAFAKEFDLAPPLQGISVRDYYCAQLADLHSADLAEIVDVDTAGAHGIVPTAKPKQVAARTARHRGRVRFRNAKERSLFGLRANVPLDEEVFGKREKSKRTGLVARLARRDR
jgi:hypothetical protein